MVWTVAEVEDLISRIEIRMLVGSGARDSLAACARGGGAADGWSGGDVREGWCEERGGVGEGVGASIALQVASTRASD